MSDLLTGSYSILEAEEALVPLLNWGGVHTLARCPTLNIVLKATVFNVWLGQESAHHQGPKELQGKLS